MNKIYAHIEKKYKNFGLNIKIDTSARILGILGASGCGKSMSLKSIAGILTPDRGKICIGERVVYESDRRIDLAPQKRKIGYLFQNYALFPNMTVYQNIAAAAKQKSAAEELLSKFHLEEMAGMYPARLSGGQQQRTALARILASCPEALLLDEPFSAMDSYLKEELQLELKERLRNFGGPVMIVSHDRDELYRLCDQILIMDEGKNIICKETKSLFDNPEKMQAARLTGCKNISKAVRVGEQAVRAEEWGVTFTVKKDIPKGLKYVGVRARDFLPDDEQGFLKVKALDVTDSPFERTILFHNADNPKGTMWLKMDDKKGAIPKSVYVKEEKILLLE